MMDQKFDPAGSEQLVQRFLDQELSAEERMQFVARLGRDEALRQRAIELEQLVLDASRLPRPAVPDAFVAGVMGRLAESPSVVVPGFSPAVAGSQRVWNKLTDALWVPHTFKWNLAGAFAVAALAVLVAGAVVTRRGTPAPVVTTVAAPSTALVRLVVIQPGARTVQVAGDFNGWNPARTSLEQVSDGAWAVTIPLKPGRYKYMFVVDGGMWIADPFAAEQSDDGFGSRNAVLEVRQGAAL